MKATKISEFTPERSKLRHLGVLAGGTAAASVFPSMMILDGNAPNSLVVMLSMALAAAVGLAMFRPLLSQIFARAIWWQAAFLGALVLAVSAWQGHASGDDLFIGAMLFTGSLVALISAGRAGLMEARGVFAPVAFRAGLLISMIMALADTEALLLYGVHSLNDTYFDGPSWLFFVSAAVMSVSIWGLYRLKLWAVGLNIAANIAIAAMAMGGVFDLPRPLAIGFAVTAVAQLIVPLPMLRVIIGRLRGAR